MSYLLDVQTAFPEYYYPQEKMITELKGIWEKTFFNAERIEQFHRSVLVGNRYLACPLDEYSKLNGLKAKNDRYLEVATKIGTDAVSKLIAKLDINPRDINLFQSNTVTGLSVPSLDARIMNQIELDPAVKRLPIFGLGCLAGVAGLNRVHDYLKGHPEEMALFVSVELCSLTVQLDDPSIPNLVSTGLFGDGAAAVLMVGEKHPLRKKAKLKWLQGRSQFYPNTERLMGWDFIDSGLKVVLSREVPNIAKEQIPDFVASFLHENHLNKTDVDFYLGHPGGPKVLTAIEESLELPQGALKKSWETLKEFGNMSSVSVLQVIEATLLDGVNAGEKGLAFAMGPAFCSELALVEGQ